MRQLTNKKSICIYFMLFLFFFNTISCLNQAAGMQSSLQSTCKISINAYTPFNPIQIYNDSAFELYGFPGDGSENTPYLIDGYNINITGDIGIHVVGTTKHFTISNCFFNDSTNNDGNFGINIVNAASGSCSIENNIIENAFVGISVSNAHSTLIKNNTLYDSLYGISVSSSDSSIITENNSTKCYGFAGVLINSGSDYLITKHTSILDNIGIYLCYVDSAMIKENNCTKSNEGIKIYDSEYVTILDNDLIEMTRPIALMSAPSLDITLSQNISVLNNRILDNQENFGVRISSSSSIELLYNYIDYNALNGIIMEQSNDIFIGNNNITNNNLEGISVTDCYDLTIIANEISENTLSGIKFVNTNTSDINYNNIENNGPSYGVYLDATSENNILHHNNFIENSPVPQASDDGIGNVWYDTSTNEGNYWNEYVGPGSYSLDGSAGSEDPYPLSSPSDLIIIPEFQQNYTVMAILLVMSIISLTYLIKKRRSF